MVINYLNLRIKIRTLCVLLTIFSVSFAQAQFKVTGSVKSASDNMPLPGVNVVVEGTTIGTITDFDGNFVLNANSGTDVLVFSMVGMLSETVPLNNQANVSVSLVEDLIGLEEVVVVGYGTMKKSDITGSIVSMKEEQLTEIKSNNVLESLQGKAAGVDIQKSNGRAGAGVDINIRGNRSLTASNAPLIIVDGVPYGDDINIDPNDIASVEILKDASSTAIYGSRGANGVIIITTKKGASGQSKVFFNMYSGVSEAYQQVPVFDRNGYITAKIDANRDINDWATEPDPVNVFPGDEYTGYLAGTETNWQDEVTRLGKRQDYHVGFMGGSDNLVYNTSVNYYKEKGVVLADDFERLTSRLNLEAKVNKYIRVGGSSMLTYKNLEGRGPRFTDAIMMSPIVPAYDSTGAYIYQPNYANPRKSPLAQTYDEAEDRNTRIFTTFYGQVDFTNEFNFRTNIGVDLSFGRYGYMYPQKAPNEGYSESGADISHSYNYTWTNLLNYRKTLGLHTISATLGQEARSNREEIYNMYGINQDFERSLWYNLTTNKSPKISSSLEEQRMLSFFGRAEYNYDSRYIVNFTGRYDAASQLAEGNKGEFFPSASLAWRVTGEDFMSGVSLINDLKVRLGAGKSGNSAVDPYSTSASLNVNPVYVQFGDPGAEVTYNGYRPNKLSSKSLKWETTNAFNLGFDLGMFNNRVVANIDFFKSHTYDLLLEDKLPLSTGYFSVITNAGESEGKGVELNLSTVNIDNKGFKWTMQVTFSAIKDEIVALASGIDQDIANGWFVGSPIGVIYDYEKAGIWQLDEADEALAMGSEVGHIKVSDINADDTITAADRKVLGQLSPKWTGSFVNTFTFKGFDLTINIYARMGQMINAGAYAFDPRMYDNQLAIDYWTPNNPTNEYPRLDASLAEMDYEDVLRYKDGSFIKMKNITLGYNMPKNFISKAKLSSARLYVTSNNPFIIYSKLEKGIDPENDGSISWPLARTVIFGLNLEF